MNEMNPTKKQNVYKITARNYYTMNTKRSLCLLFLLLQFSLSHAQSFSNLGFDYWQGKKFPLYWQHPGITVFPDSVTKLSGQYALKAVRQQAEIERGNSPYGLLFQNVLTAFDQAAIDSKQLRVSARIKSRIADTSVYVATFLQIVDPLIPENNHIAMGNNVANQDWGTSSASITLGKITPASTVLMGIILIGKGEIWVDDYHIICYQKPSEEVCPRKTDLTAKESKWLASHIIPIDNEILTRKKQFSKKISGAQLIGIGENVHGSSSVFQLKNILSKNLIEEEDFTLLAIEDNPYVGESLNRYVLGLTDTVESVMNVMYSNSDFKKFLFWLREYNKSAAKKVRIFGVDVNGRYENQIKDIDHFTSKKFALPLDSVRSILEGGIKNWNPKSYLPIPFTAEQKQYCIAGLEQIKEFIESMDLDTTRKELLCYYANNLLHYLTFDRKEREKHMAENINWLLARHPDEKMIYLAHNSHVGNQKKQTGMWLKKMFKEKYYMIGCCYFDGTDSFKQYALGNSQPVINEAIQGSYEYLFNQIKEECFYLDVSKLTEHPVNQWLFQPMLMRNYGVEPFNYYHEFEITDLSRVYDGIVFIKRSVPL